MNFVVEFRVNAQYLIQSQANNKTFENRSENKSLLYHFLNLSK